MKFITACMKFFEKKEGQSIKNFLDETKELTEQDRKDLTPDLEKELDTEIED